VGKILRSCYERNGIKRKEQNGKNFVALFSRIGLFAARRHYKTMMKYSPAQTNDDGYWIISEFFGHCR
jgi:hypothetical protein